MRGIDNQVLLSEISEGGLQERFDYELKKVAENVMDPNTDIKKKRKITITIEVASDDFRDQLYFASEVKSTLAPREKVNSKVLIGIDNDGDVITNPLHSGERGQMFFDPNDSKLKTDKGQEVEELEKEQQQTETEPTSEKSGEVIDFRNQSAN
ncbi:hypothetical protein [Enterococcus wangshanyuanii]|uniref:Replication terminator protein n=1 Tax=Enterococcus wangshanyuanii TaxID=2005703 RepID=A0ABQ1P2T9_9ENTE|nr:hypothetical protein [Enterococcus wangshanyuanii]GGC88252.1 hypothetical protein GCM10011573_17330 [Enterococcus wangshanyuanii]